MTTLGFDKPLYILPFDHRGSFQKKMFGWDGELTPEQTAEIAAAKRVIYDAFQEAIQTGVPKDKAGILVDEQFGAAILRDAAPQGYSTACPAEKSGQDEFDFEYGDDFAKHIEAFRSDLLQGAGALQPGGRPGAQPPAGGAAEAPLGLSAQRQEPAAGSCSNCWSQRRRRSSNELNGDKKAYDLAASAAADGAGHRSNFRMRGVEPDVWKIEGLDRREDCENVVAAARRGGRNQVGCIILGRGEDDKKVREWLTTAAAVPGFIGFAVGRTSFWDPLVDWRGEEDHAGCRGG